MVISVLSRSGELTNRPLDKEKIVGSTTQNKNKEDLNITLASLDVS